MIQEFELEKIIIISDKIRPEIQTTINFEFKNYS